MATTQNNLGLLYSALNEFSQAELALQEALEIKKRLAKANPTSYEPDVASTQNNLGNLYNARNEFGKAELAYQEALEIYRKFAKTQSDKYTIEVARTCLLNGINAARLNKEDESIFLLREALQLADQYAHIPLARNINHYIAQIVEIEKVDPILAEWQQKVAPLEEKLEHEENKKKIVEVYQEVVQVWKEAHTAHPLNLRIITQLASSYSILSWYLLFVPDFIEAEKAALRGLAVDPSETWINTNYASALVFQGRFEEASSIYTKFKDQLFDVEKTWQQAFLEDLAALEAAGITHPDVAKVRALLEY